MIFSNHMQLHTCGMHVKIDDLHSNSTFSLLLWILSARFVSAAVYPGKGKSFEPIGKCLLSCVHFYTILFLLN